MNRIQTYLGNSKEHSFIIEAIMPILAVERP
jgi:hypothetical protein